MKKNVFSILLTFICLLDNSYMKAADILWSTASSPVVISADFTLNAGDRLIIEPGVQVLMNGYFQLILNGQVIAKGTDVNPISFRSYDTTGFHNRDIPNGGWKGIRILSTGTVKFDTFENCHFQNLKMIAYEDMLMFFGPVFINKCRFYKNTSPDFYMSAAAMIHVFNSNDSINYPIIRNSRFYNNDVRNRLIYAGCNNFEFTNNEVNDNNWGYGLGIYGNNANGSNVIVKKNKFFNNSSRFFTMGGNGGPLSVYRINDFYFQDNKVYGNSIPGTAGILMWNCRGIVERNLFANNLSNSFSNCMGTSGGVIMLSGGEDSLKAEVVTTIFRNNIIANNMTTSYGVLSLHYTNIEVANNTFVNNSTSFFGPSIYTWGQDRNYKVINNIFQNNRSGGEMLFGNNEMFLANHNHFEVNNNLMDKPLVNSLVDYYELGVDFSLGDTSLNIVNTSSVLVSPTADTGYIVDALSADFSLIAGTAAIDAGLHSGISLAPTDYLNHVRVINGIVDLGAIEYGSSNPTSITPLENDNTCLLFPNPCSGQLNVQFDAIQSGVYIIYDLQGRMVKQSAYDGKLILNINLEHFTNGNYVIYIENKKGRCSKQFSVIN